MQAEDLPWYVSMWNKTSFYYISGILLEHCSNVLTYSVYVNYFHDFYYAALYIEERGFTLFKVNL